MTPMGVIFQSAFTGVKRVKRDDRVYIARNLTGAYAEYVLAREEQIHPLPGKIDFKQAAGVWVSYGTAYHALYHWAKARASETALVHGASGGVGIAALQIARAIGLEVFGTAGTSQGLETAKREGRIKFSITAKPDIRKKFCKRRTTAAWTLFWRWSPT
jgi:NADPH:quinone reductase